MQSPLTVEVYDGAFRMKGTVGNPVSLTVNPRHNQQPTASLTVTADHIRLPDLAAPGARVVLRYQGAFLMSGMVRLRSGEGPHTTGTVTLQIVDDFRLLSRVLGWTDPGAALTAQGTDTAFDNRSGPAESVLKGYITANAKTRLGLPITVAADQARGANITAKIRFTPLADTLLPLIDTAGIGVTVQQSGAGLVVDCYTPRTIGRVLSEASGVVQEWSWDQADPEATRVIAGGPDAGTNRVFRQVIDANLEAQYHDVIEAFTDANDAADPAALIAKATAALDEAGPKAGLSLKLSETTAFRYDPTGINGVRVGDKVRVEVGPGVVVEDVLREATLEWTTDNGLVVTPVIGDRSNDPNRTLVQKVSRLFRDVRNMTAGR